jgi:WD40 repeat protein
MTEMLVASDNEKLGAIPDCPYKGLVAYTEADGEYFFGRELDRDLVIANLRASRLTVLYGPSGVGKSSLLQAGVMRHLRQMPESAFSYLAARNALIVYHSSWRGDSLKELGSALLKAIPVADGIQDIIERRPQLSVKLLGELGERLKVHIYLLLDQFEEQTLHQAGAERETYLDEEHAFDQTAQQRRPNLVESLDQTARQREAFLEELGNIITTPALRVSTLLGVREDALATLDRLEAYVPGLFDNNFRLHHLNRAAAREAIKSPLTRYNLDRPSTEHVTIETELIEVLLQQLQTGSVSVGDAGQGGMASAAESIETPFLQLVMTRLWAEEAKRGSCVLRRETLRSLGGAGQIVRTHLDEVMSDLTGRERDTVAEIFRFLVTPSGMKIPLTVEDLAEFSEVDQAQVSVVLEKLAASPKRVLRPVPAPLGSDEPPRYEIFHDVMVPAVVDWRRRYVGERERIARERALLLERRQAEEELILERRQAEEKFRKTRKRYALLSLALALLLVMATAIVALVLQGRNYEQRALLAHYEAKLAQYDAELDTDPAASLKAALQAWHERATPEAERAVRSALEADNQRLVLRADRGSLTSGEFSSDGSTLLTAGSDGTATLFNATTGQLIGAFQPRGTEPPPTLLQASASADGTMVLTAAANKTVRIYDFHTGRDIGILARASRATWGTVSGHPVVLTFGDLSAARLWDPQTLRQIGKYGDRALEAALSPDGQHVLTVDFVNGRVALSVWDAISSRRLQTSTLAGLSVSATEAQFVTAGWNKVVFHASDRRVMLWDWQQGPDALQPTNTKSRLPGHIAVSKDGRVFAAALDKYVRVFNAEKGQPIGQIPDQADGINAVALSADGRWLVTGGHDGKALVWNAHRTTNRPIAELIGHDWDISDVQFDPSSPWRLITASKDGTVRTWQLAPHTDLTAGSERMLDTDINGELMLVTAGDTGDLRIYQHPTDGGIDQWRLLAHTSLSGSGLGTAKLTPDGRTVASARLGDFAPSVWAWQSGKPPHHLSASDRILTALAISGDGRGVAAGDRSNRVTLWDLSSGARTAPRQLGDDGYQITSMTYVPRSPLVAAASADGTVRLFDPAKVDQPLRTLGNVGDPSIKALDVSADGTHLATVSEDRNVRVWRISDGTLEKTIEGPPSTSTDIALSRDGRLLAVATADGVVYIWEWQTNKELAQLRRHVDAINSVQFSPEGNNIISASDDANVAIFPCTTCQPFNELLKTAEEQDRNHG